MCFDGVKRLCHIRGKLRKKVWINQSDIVLIGLRDYQDAKADVILKYSADEARNLNLTENFQSQSRSTRRWTSSGATWTMTSSLVVIATVMTRALVMMQTTLMESKTRANCVFVT